MLGFSFYTFCSTSIPFHSLQSIRIGQRDQLNCRLCYLIWMHAPSLQSNPISMNRRNQYGTLLIAENGTVPTRAEFRNRSEVRRLLKVANLFISRWSSDWINGKKNKLQSNYGFPPSLFFGMQIFPVRFLRWNVQLLGAFYVNNLRPQASLAAIDIDSRAKCIPFTLSREAPTKKSFVQILRSTSLPQTSKRIYYFIKCRLGSLVTVTRNMGCDRIDTHKTRPVYPPRTTCEPCVLMQCLLKIANLFHDRLLQYLLSKSFKSPPLSDSKNWPSFKHVHKPLKFQSHPWKGFAAAPVADWTPSVDPNFFFWWVHLLVVRCAHSLDLRWSARQTLHQWITGPVVWSRVHTSALALASFFSSASLLWLRARYIIGQGRPLLCRGNWIWWRDEDWRLTSLKTEFGWVWRLLMEGLGAAVISSEMVQIIV